VNAGFGGETVQGLGTTQSFLPFPQQLLTPPDEISSEMVAEEQPLEKERRL